MYTQKEIEQAYQRIKGYIHKTPIINSQSINNMFGCEISFKCENFQKIGAFKIRGALNACLQLNKSNLSYGVITHSSGNHAQALALSAKILKTTAYIIMPKNSSKVKVDAVKSYGGEIIFCEPNQQSREETTREIQKQTKAKFIHPYDNKDIILGQATVAYELLQEQDKFDIVMAPVGGGGLLAGTCLAVKNYNSGIKVIGAEPKMADDAYRSMKEKTIQESINPNTIADGLRTSLGIRNFEIMKQYLDDIVLCSEESIKKSLKIVYERLKIVIEPSSAVPLACIMDNPEFFKNKKICIIISGGNIDLSGIF